MYNEEMVIESLRAEINRFMVEVESEMEVIVVNDGSTDLTLSKLADWAADDERIKIVNLSRNFGHQIASTAGLDYAGGSAVVLLDADLQDPLVVIHQMIERYCQGYEVVYGQREKREGESLFKRLTAWVFYRLMRALVYKNLPADAGDFRLLSRECLDALQSMRETHRFLRGMVAWVGYPQCAVKYRRVPRVSGETKYSLRKMVSLAWTAATSFSTLPLQISIVIGLLVGLLGIEETIRALIEAMRGRTVPGWTSLMVLTSLVGSALLIGFGILGQYIAKIYEESKDRPLYFVAQTFNMGAGDPLTSRRAMRAGNRDRSTATPS